MSINNLAAKRMFEAIKTTPQQFSNALGTEIVAGVVLSVNPLRVQIEAEPPLDRDYLVVSALCKSVIGWHVTSYMDELDHTHYVRFTAEEADGHSHVVERALIDQAETAPGHIHESGLILTNSVKNSNGILHHHIINSQSSEPTEGIFDENHIHKFPEGTFSTEPAEGHSHDFTFKPTVLTLVQGALWRDIIPGDIVNMIRMSGNQRYYVIERQGMESEV